MKKIIITQLIILAFDSNLFSQSTCSNVKVITPVVQKPTQGELISVTCSALQVQWKGTANQSYIASAAYYNTSTKKWNTVNASSNSCDEAFNCKATIPVKGGTKVSWSVQASQVINNRTFYSYYLIGARDYPIPACTKVAANIEEKKIAQQAEEPVVSMGKLIVHPNPATSEITIQWSSEYKGNAQIAITDATGKVVRLLNVNKERAEYTNRINISNLAAGLYYVAVQTQNGQQLNAKFFKE